MTFFHLVVVLAVIAGCAAVAAGRVRGGLPEPTDPLPEVVLPPGQVGPKDIDDVRFSVGFRGYRMDEVDQVLDRLSGEIAQRDAQLAEYRGQVERSAFPASEPSTEASGATNATGSTGATGSTNSTGAATNATGASGATASGEPPPVDSP